METSLIYSQPELDKPLRQGELLSNVVQYIPSISEDSSIEKPKIRSLTQELSIIVTQSCDLERDHEARQKLPSLQEEWNQVQEKRIFKTPDEIKELQKDIQKEKSKLLNSVILCYISEAKFVRKLPSVNSEAWNLIKSNRSNRYHFLEMVPDDCDLLLSGTEELTADFKNVFGIHSVLLHQQIEQTQAKRRTRLVSPYLEHFSHRFYSFHSQVALPEAHKSVRGG
jgi:hypothetical protein